MIVGSCKVARQHWVVVRWFGPMQKKDSGYIGRMRLESKLTVRGAVCGQRKYAGSVRRQDEKGYK